MKTEREIIQDLAGGFTVKDEIDGYDSELYMQPPGRYDVTHNQIQLLIDAGWLDRFPNGCGYRLSDEGLKAHNRAMDEMGDGELIAPNTIKAIVESGVLE
jgi:hypothetical protein